MCELHSDKIKKQMSCELTPNEVLCKQYYSLMSIYSVIITIKQTQGYVCVEVTVMASVDRLPYYLNRRRSHGPNR